MKRIMCICCWIFIMTFCVVSQGLPQGAPIAVGYIDEQTIALETALAEKKAEIEKLKVEVLEWKKRYYDTMIANMEIIQTIKMLKSDRYKILKSALDKTEREIRQLKPGDKDTEKTENGKEKEDE